MNHDRVDEAYAGAFGDEFMIETRNRCNWIANKAESAEWVLDVGCSQGTISALVAKSGSYVVGIDNEHPSIEYANDLRSRLDEAIQDRLTFVCGDFLNHDFGGRTFDCVIASEILEHVFNPDLMLKKAVSLLSDRGRLIVTVPFGINPHPDHKRTYYFLDMFKSISALMPVSEVVLFGKWIGFVGDRAASRSITIDEDLVARLESSFFEVDGYRLKSFEDVSAKARRIQSRLEACSEDCLNAKAECKRLEAELSKTQSAVVDLRERLSRQTDKRQAYEAESLRAKQSLKTVTIIARRYRDEYEKVLRSRSIKLWLKIRKMLGRQYKPYHFDIPALNDSTARSSVGKAESNPSLPAVRSGLIDRFKGEWQDDVRVIADSNGSSYYKKAPLRAGIITDEFMYNYYKDALEFTYLSPENYREEVDKGDLSFVLFVSCWHGLGDGTDYNSRDKRNKVRDIFDYARAKGVTTVFQTIEDPTNFEMFLPIAQKADVIFTSDANMVDRYREETGNQNVHVLEYGINPLVHNPIGFLKRHFVSRGRYRDAAFFAGSWYKRYPVRCDDCAVLFDGVLECALKDLIIADRNSALLPAKRKDYEYPDKYKPYCMDAIDHTLLQKVHKLFDYCISLSTVKDSDTMCAMRVYEMQALGCLMLSNYALSISSHFPSVFMVSEPREVDCILTGYSSQELINLQVEGIRRMYGGCTVYDRLNEIFDAAGIDYSYEKKSVAVICGNENNSAVRRALDRQTYKHVELCSADSFWDEDRDRFGYVVYADAESLNDPYFVEDAINAFKFTDSSYVNYGAGRLCRSSYDYVSGTAAVANTFYDLSKLDGKECIFDEAKRSSLKGFELVKTKWGRDTSGTEKELGVIVPIYNNGKYLLNRCFLSLLRSSVFDSMRVYLIDDGSTDPDTKDIIDSLVRDYDNVVAYRFEDGGSGSASRPRNKGLELCEEPFVTYLDPDNEAVNDGYATLLRYVKEQGVDFAVGTILKIAAPAFRAVELSPSYAEGVNESPSELLLSSGFKGQSVQACVIRRKFLLDAGIQNVPGAIGQDTLFYYEMMLNASAFYHVRMPIHIYYAERAGSAVNRISRSFFDKSLLLERHQVEVLKQHGVFEAYKKVKLDAFMKGWYEEKLKQVASEDLEYGKKIIAEIRSLYR